MKIAKILCVAATFLSLDGVARAEHTWDWHMNDRFVYVRDADLYNANEFTLDLYGSYKRGHGKWNDFFDSPDHGVWGGGVGANYFFTKYLGAGADVSMHADGGQFIDNASGNLYARFPIEPIGLAPYVFGGLGGNFDPKSEWEGHFGAGLEFRLNPHTGIFADARYVFPDDTSDYSMIRAGMRFGF